LRQYFDTPHSNLNLQMLNSLCFCQLKQLRNLRLKAINGNADLLLSAKVTELLNYRIIFMTQKNSKDLKQLKILSICHYLYGSLFMSISLFAISFSIKGIISILVNPQSSSQSSSNPILAVVLFAILLSFVLILSICLIASGHYLVQRKRYWFIRKIAQIESCIFPLGTILGLYTLYILSKTSVKSLYGIDSNR
jgi:hypothetical protein